MSGDQSVTPPTPVSRSPATAVPAVVSVTKAALVASVRGPSSSSAVTRTGPAGGVAASIVAWTCTARSGVSTLTGFANTSDTNTSGTTRSMTSR